ncbi:MAG: flippase-like domain-containing protein [Candidatus Aminicenantes bacterium]|nr:MAG: flippase-like domain-containing protein [Candidatus Aminicenantes bacterium]
MKKNHIRAIVLFALTFVFLFFFFRSVEWNEVLGYLNDIDLTILIVLMLLVPLNFVLRAIRWKCLLKHEKEGVSFYNRFAANAVGFAVTGLFPGRLGELIKPLYLAQKEGLKKGFAIGTVVVERMFDLFNMCFLLGVFFISRPLYISIFNIEIEKEAYSNLALWGIIGIAIASIMLFVTLSLYFFKTKTLKIITFFLKPLSQKWRDQILGLIDEFIEGLKFFHSAGDIFVYIFWSLMVWINIAFMYWIWLGAYNIRVPFFYIFPFVFLTMVGASIPTPGMVGGFDYFSKYGLTSLYGVETNLAVGMTLVIHAIQLAVTYVIGYGILWKEGISLLQVKKLGEKTKQ